MSSPKYCPSCGAPIKEGAKFCGTCGFNLSQLPNASAPPMGDQAGTIPPINNVNENNNTVIPPQSPNHTSSYSTVSPYGSVPSPYGSPASYGTPGTAPAPGTIPPYGAPTPTPAAPGQPSGITFATFAQRAVAFIIDLLLVSFLLALFMPSGDAMDPTLRLIESVVIFFYFAIMEAVNHGKTLGKAVMKLRVVDAETFGDISFGQAIIDSLGKVFFLLIDLLLGLIFRSDQVPVGQYQIRICQRWAKVVVIREIS